VGREQVLVMLVPARSVIYLLWTCFFHLYLFLYWRILDEYVQHRATRLARVGLESYTH